MPLASLAAMGHWRGWRGWLAGLGVLLAAACASTGPAGGDNLLPRAVAPGVYVLPGEPGDADPANAGRVGNTGFVVGPGGVLVVDSGTSAAQGQALLAAVRRVTPQPVRGLLLTHVRQEVVFGAAAFQQAGVPVFMHPEAALLMAARCGNCLKSLQRLLGDEAMAGTRVVKPDRLLAADGAGLPDIGRPLQVLHFGHASGPGDVALLDTTTGTLFAGGLADVGSVPDVQDGRLPAWQAALGQLAARPLRQLVPGRGPVQAAGPALAAMAAYLQALQAQVRGFLAADRPLSEVADAAELPAYAGWARYATVQRRNAAVLFVRFEAEALAGSTPSGGPHR